MPADPKLIEHYRSRREAALDELQELLRIPSISTLPEHRPDVRRAAELLRDRLAAMGLNEARLIEGPGHPLVCAEWLEAPGKPTLVLYGHYDVQPPDPLDEWVSPPFEPQIRNGNLYARGAVDDKGQLSILLEAIRGLLAVHGRLPVNVKFLIEGEEESDGRMIASYLEREGSQLGADAALICDTDMFAPDLPTLTIGLRGIVYAEIEVRGARTDLHSGMYGGVAPNPFQALAEILTGLKDAEGKILIPGFYEEVEPPSSAEKVTWERLPFDEERFREEELGSESLTGEPDHPPLERIWARPTFEVHGIRGGFTGEGAKTVIPAKATAKVSMRLVPRMDAKRIARLFEEHVARLRPEGVSVATRVLAASPASIVPTDSPYIQKAGQALAESFGKPAVFIRSGGSIPVVGLFQRHAGIPSVLMGFGLPDDNLHAPNEKFTVANFYRGVEAIGRYLEMLGE